MHLDVKRARTHASVFQSTRTDTYSHTHTHGPNLNSAREHTSARAFEIFDALPHHTDRLRLGAVRCTLRADEIKTASSAHINK